MKKRYTEKQIFEILKEAKEGLSIPALSRKHGISTATYYNWKKKYHGLNLEDIKRLKKLETQNSRLKQIVAELTLDVTVLKEALGKKW